MDIHLKRIYESPSDEDGFRVLVDRLWPRGISRESASLDLWLKDLAPSTDLRKWFHGHLDQFETFRHRYLEELEFKTEMLQQLIEQVGDGTLTLLYASRQTEQNHAHVLRDALLEWSDTHP
jgi:uncharacterized protein YeaO (DUF488 family)